ncbi:MAG: cysteine desulfurase [Pirellulaceae bacterium]|nr:MAG: cysteine desulfurase [Pirellulaceae bacterium]
MNVASFRQQMPVARRWAYFDHAAVAPLPQPARVAVEQWAAEAAEEGDTRWPQWVARLEQVRHRAAELVGAHPDEIAFVSNTTSGINLIAEAFPWKNGDNVVVPANEFPSNIYPWMNLERRGVKARLVPVHRSQSLIPQLEAACDRHTRLVALSWVSYADGWRVDLDELAEFAKRRGIELLLDAIQGLGLLPIDLGHYPIDYLVADGHKWMLGPEGAGILYIRRERLDQLQPLNVGWHSVVHAHDFSRIDPAWRPDAARYEGGSPNMAGCLALGASLDLLASFGLSKDQSPLADYVLELLEELARRIRHVGGQVVSTWAPQNRSGILAFRLPQVDLAFARRSFLAQGVVLSARNGALRISPHAYCDQEDVNRFTDALERLCTAPAAS